MVLTCIEDLINTNRKTIEQFRARFFAPPEDAIFRVGPIGQGEHRHRFIQRVDNPVLRNASFGVVARFFLQVARRIVGTDDFQHQIRTAPVVILPSDRRRT